jgi:hypothetical protein
MNSMKSYGSDNFNNHYVYSDLDLWPVTLDQGRDTSLGPVKQFCEILFQYMLSVKIYGLDNV